MNSYIYLLFFGQTQPVVSWACPIEAAGGGKKMKTLSKSTLQLEEYRCRRCNRSFYIESGDRGSLEFDFGCPYGCDDDGRYIRSISTEAKHVR